MAPSPLDTRAALRGLIARLDVEEFVLEVERRASELPAYRRFVRDGDGDTDRGRAAIRWNVELFTRWLSDGTPPGEADLQQLGALVQARLREGMSMQDGLLVYRRNARAGWDTLVAMASTDEREALLRDADVLVDYVDTVTDAFARAYTDQADPAAVAEERRARHMLERLIAHVPLGADDHQRAEALGFPIQDSYRPFAVCLIDRSARQHAALAHDLRRAGALATAEARRVAGLTAAAFDWPALGYGSALLVAEDRPAPRSALDEHLEDARALLTIAHRHDRRGIVHPEQHLIELLVASARRHSDRISDRVYGPLRRNDELARTLQTLAEHNFDRSAAAAALPVHRNTLLYRAHKIEQLTGLRLATTEDQTLIWLATIRRTAGPDPG
jgi:hypothetical protein